VARERFSGTGVAQSDGAAANLPFFSPVVVPDLCPPAGWRVRFLGGDPAEHPLLGSITVPRLVEAGAVQVSQIDDPETALTDIWLTLQSRANGEDGQLTYEASREPLPLSKADSP
jgi:hypothetical protein